MQRNQLDAQLILKHQKSAYLSKFTLDWSPLKTEQEVQNISDVVSHETPCVIFKHSTTCSISAIAKHRVKDYTDSKCTGFKFYYLDLLSFRPVSNFISELFDVQHESPQLLIIKDGKCVYNESHLSISSDILQNQLEPTNG